MPNFSQTARVKEKGETVKAFQRPIYYIKMQEPGDATQWYDNLVKKCG